MKMEKKTCDGMHSSIVATLIIGVISCSIVVVAGLLFSNFESISQKEIINESTMSDHYINSNLSQKFNAAWINSYRIFSDSAVGILMSHQMPDVYETQQAFSQLSDYHLTNSSILSVYVYNSVRDTLYVESGRSDISSTWPSVSSTGDFPDPDALREAHDYSKHKPFMPFLRIIYRGNKNQAYCYSFLVYDYHASNPGDHYVMVNFDYNEFIPQESLSYAAESSEVIVVNSLGVTMAKSKNFQPLKNISTQPYVGTILKSETKTGHFSSNVGGTDCLVTYDKDNPYGWAVISVVSWSEISEKTKQIKLFSLLSLIAMLAILTLTAQHFLHRTFVKLSGAIAELSSTKKQISAGNAALGNSFLRDLLLGREIFSDEYIASNLEKYALPWELAGCIRVVLIHVGIADEYLNGHTQKEWDSVKQSVIAKAEILLRAYESKGIDVGKQIIALIVRPSPASHKIEKEKFLRGIAELQQAFSDDAFWLDVAISETAPFAQINILYQSAEAVLDGRFFRKSGSAVFASDIEERPVQEYVYPDKEEKQITNCLRNLNEVGAVSAYEEFVQKISLYPKLCAEIALTRLADRLNLLITPKETGLKLVYPLSTPNIFEANSFFQNAFHQVCSILNANKSSKYPRIVFQIDQIINTEYTSNGLSIEYIAGKVQLSASYVSRIYKEFTGFTVLDKIVNVRIKKSKELLLETKISAFSIAQAVGFSSASYFNSVFKKITGQTPNQFRKEYKGQPF